MYQPELKPIEMTNELIYTPEARVITLSRSRITLCVNERCFTLEIERGEITYDTDDVISRVKLYPARSVSAIEVISLVSCWGLGYQRSVNKRERYIFTTMLHDIELISVIPLESR